uniref:Glutamic acid-rich protein-like n=1 Tax=Tanacetum cinerariifolium TaxID=118510 RepID=A0A6L2NYH9_TANCI|nr:hypothetical protein [Tanacetum cinerariifolium]
MSSLFADTHNVVAILEKSDAAEAQMGYEKPSTKLTFYKAFFSSQWKFLIHTILQSLSAKRTSWNEFSTAMASAVICLSKGQKFNFSKYIFDSLVRNVDSSSKFYMYPRFIQLIIQNQVRDLSTHTTRFISPALTQKVFENMRRVGKGFSGVETPLFEGMLVARQPAEEGLVVEQVQVDDAVKENVTEDVAHDAIPSPPSHNIPSPSQESSSPPQQPQKNDNATQKLVIIKLKARIKRLEKANMVKSSKLRRLRTVGASKQVESSDDMEDVFNQRRIIDDWIKMKGLNLDHSSKVLSTQEDDSEVQKVVEVVTTAKLITEVVTATASQVSAASATIPAAKPSIPAAAPTVVAAYTRRRKGVIIRNPEEELSLKTHAETPKVKDKGKVNPSLNIQNEPDAHELFISKLIQQKLQNEYAQPFPAIAITFDLPTVEPEDSLRMGDEHLDSILETESDEFIKSSVENLVPSPSEPEDLSEKIISMKIDLHHYNAESDLIESLLNHDSSIISSSTKIDYLLDEFADELILLKTIPPGIHETDYDPEEEIRLIEKLLYDNSSPQLLSNDSLSLPENESFHFDIPSSSRPPAKPLDNDLEILTVKVVGDISELYVPIPRLLPIQSTLVSNQEKYTHLLSHQGLKDLKLHSEYPMMIYGGNTPILNVPFLHFYPP